MTPGRTALNANPHAAPGHSAQLGAATALLLVQLSLCGVGLREDAARPVSPEHVQLRLDPNRATAAELELLPRIGAKIADEIIEYRESIRDGPAFRTAADLDRVPRIGPLTVELLRPYLQFPDTPRDPSNEQRTP